MNEQIAVIDDEPDILELVALHLERAFFSIEKFSEAKDSLKFLDNNSPTSSSSI